jgi:hypothetical protein
MDTQHDSTAENGPNLSNLITSATLGGFTVQQTVGEEQFPYPIIGPAVTLEGLQEQLRTIDRRTRFGADKPADDEGRQPVDEPDGTGLQHGDTLCSWRTASTRSSAASGALRTRWRVRSSKISGTKSRSGSWMRCSNSPGAFTMPRMTSRATKTTKCAKSSRRLILASKRCRG